MERCSGRGEQLRGYARAWRMCGHGRRSTHHADEFLVYPRPVKLDQQTSTCVEKRLLEEAAARAPVGAGHPLTDSVLTQTVEPDGRTPDLAILAGPRWRTALTVALTVH